MVLVRSSKNLVPHAVVPAESKRQRNTKSRFLRASTTVRPSVWAAKGELGENGGGYGDLLVSVYVQPNRVFVRKGNDIYCDVPITFVQAALGGEITIKTIDGEQKYTIKPGTQPDTVVTLRGVGVPNLRNPKIRGNQIVSTEG